MITDFKDAMSKRSDNELVKIVTVDRNDYQPLAVEAAEQEIKNRGIDTTIIEQVKLDLAKESEKQVQLNSKKVGLGKRFINFIIDSVIWLFITFILTYPLNAHNESQMMLGYVFLILSFIGYYTIMETRYQKTVGKFITHTTVVTNNGTKPKVSDILKRTFCRFIPFDRVSYLFTQNGFHDKLSNTTIVKDLNHSA